MDIVLHGLGASAAEREAVDGVLGPEGGAFEGAGGSGGGRVGRGGRVARGRRHLLLPALHAVQDRVGWISPGALEYICERLVIAPAEAWGVASFYALFSLEPQPVAVAHVCSDVACLAAGAEGLCAGLLERLGEPGQPRDDVGATWFESPCLGLCDRAPGVFVAIAGQRAVGRQIAPASVEGVVGALGGELAGAPVVVGALAGEPVGALAGEPAGAPLAAAVVVGQAGGRGLRLLRRVGVVDPESIDDYRAHGGFGALRAAVDLGPEGVLRELGDSGLLGRGGAAFATARKWEAVARSPRRPRYVVCNADESEPGTFKDRVLLEGDPFAVIEALTIAGLTCGCDRGYVYVRGEYPLAFARLAGAIEQARERGYLGEGILGGQACFEIELRRGAGAYICGEETALFASIEGYRGEPRNKPPFPVEAGLFGRPTVVNNVETLVNVLDIVTEGGAAFARIGTASSTGTRLFCLSGAVSRPGVYEVAMGTRLSQLLELAGGVRDGGRLVGVLLGGAAGRFIGPDELDVELSFEGTRQRGLTMGSGVVVVFDQRVDLVGVLGRIAAFFRDESCGQCVPCRVGTVRQQEALARLAAGRSRGSVGAEIALLGEIAAAMRDGSICGLGQTAADAIASALERFDLFASTGGSR